MIQEYQLRVLPETAANEQRLKEYLIQEKGLNVRNITATRILKRSIDARQRTIFVNLTVRVYLNEMPKEGEYRETIYNNVSDKPQVVFLYHILFSSLIKTLWGVVPLRRIYSL